MAEHTRLKQVCLRFQILLHCKMQKSCELHYQRCLANTPYARRIYIINDNDSPEFAAVYEVGSAIVGFSGPVDISFTATSFADGTFVLSQRRFEYPEGYRMTLRLYPRQSEDYDLTIRYVYRPKRLVEDTDTPDLPQSHHIVLAYACLADVLAKHDNFAIESYLSQEV